jgi:hypothetical protein
VYVAGWALVSAVEGLAYLWASGDFLHRFHVVNQHYGTVDSIARAGLNTDPRTIPFSILAPVTWWLYGGWGELNQDQAYHGLLFFWAAASLAAGGVALAFLRGRADGRSRAGFAVALVWLLWPLLYHQFGSQSVTHLVPIHRLSRHLVVYAPGAILAIVAGCFLIREVLRTVPAAGVRRVAASIAAATLAVHTWFNWKGERVAFEAFHRVKDTYVRILERLPVGTQTVVADPGDLCFLDFWLNPLGAERVRMVPFAAYQRCNEMPAGVVLTHSNPGWHDQAPIIVETVKRLPCLADPPATWRVLYQGYPERVFQIAAGDASARN